MITEGETEKFRGMAKHIGKGLNADYSFFDIDENENVTLVLKYGEFNSDTYSSDILDFILGE